MIVLGFVLVVLSWALPQIFPDAPPPMPALEHVAWVLGWIFVVIGLFLLLFGHFTGRAIAGRRYWW
jgi:hypothetical protein